jgi:alcohol dehydrogenase class IV
MRFEFTTANRIIFGRNALSEVAPIAADWGCRALLITGRNDERASGLKEALVKQGMAVTACPVCGEPTLSAMRESVKIGREDSCDVVIGMGGGSVIDAGKTVAALLTNGGELLDYLEIIGAGQSLKNPPLPYIAIPTTAGTGTEATANAVIKSPEHGRKVSFRGRFLLPAVAVVDPVLTMSMPPVLTASTGMDALTQLIEAFVSQKANPMTDALCREGLCRLGRSLRRAWREGEDLDARENMSLAALLSGMALANAGLGAVHGFAAVIGGMTDAPHGVVCARLLHLVLVTNLERLQEREDSSPVLGKFEELGQLLTGKPGAGLTEGVAWIRSLGAELNLPTLEHYGLKATNHETIAAMAKQASSMRGNPVDLSEEDLIKILEMERRQPV